MIRVFLAGFFCLIAVVAEAAPSRFSQANERFESSDIAGAADIYQEILAREGPSSAVLFNLGNCEQRLGHYGPAILAYERARLLTPRDPDLRANLALARKAAAVFEEPVRHPRVDAFFSYLSLNEWSWLVAGSALVLGALAVLRGCLSLRRRGMRLAFGVAAGAAGLFLIVGAVALYLRRGEDRRAVVLAEGAAVRLSPFEKAETLGTPSPGRIVHLLESKDGYHYVEVPGTELRGWMADREVAAIQSGEPERSS